MSNHLTKDICKLNMPGQARMDIDDRTINKFLPPHVRYACLYWVYHFNQSNASIRDADEIHLFLKCHFIHWLEALSLLGEMSKSIMTINTLQALVEVGCFEKSLFPGNFMLIALLAQDRGSSDGFPERRNTIYTSLYVSH